MIRVVSVLDDVCIFSSAQCCCVDGELDSGLYSTRSRSSILRQITKPCSKNWPRSQHPVCARCLWGQCGDAHASSGMFWTYLSYSSTWVITGLFLRIFERFRPVFMIFFLEFGGPYLSTLNPCPWTCCTLVWLSPHPLFTSCHGPATKAVSRWILASWVTRPPWPHTTSTCGQQPVAPHLCCMGSVTRLL